MTLLPGLNVMKENAYYRAVTIGHNSKLRFANVSVVKLVPLLEGKQEYV